MSSLYSMIPRRKNYQYKKSVILSYNNTPFICLRSRHDVKIPRSRVFDRDDVRSQRVVHARGIDL